MHPATSTATTFRRFGHALGDALEGLALGALALALRPFKLDVVLTYGRLWLPDGAPWIAAMRHPDGTISVAFGRREVTIGKG